jgi:hypothetical protein
MRRYQRLHEAKKDNNLPLIHNFLGKHVHVKVDNSLTVEGVLIRYKIRNKADHSPDILILKDGDSYHILRGNFENLSVVTKRG